MALLLLVFSAIGVSSFLVQLARIVGSPRKADRTDRGRTEHPIEERRAEAQAQMESHDIEDMLDAIAEYRRRAGRRSIGEELSDEWLRSSWED